MPLGASLVRWPHFVALLAHGVPARDLVRDGDFTFGVVQRYGREFIVTDAPRVRAYFDTVLLPVRVDAPSGL